MADRQFSSIFYGLTIKNRGIIYEKIRQKKMLKMVAFFMVMVMSVASLWVTRTAETLSCPSGANITITGLRSGSSVTELGCISFSWDVYLNSDLTKVATGVKKSITRQYTVSRA